MVLSGGQSTQSGQAPAALTSYTTGSRDYRNLLPALSFEREGYVPMADWGVRLEIAFSSGEGGIGGYGSHGEY